MSTELVNYEAQLLALATAGTEAERPSNSTISLRAGQITYGGSTTNKLDCIIVASTHANLYFDKPFDPDAIISPACYAYSEDGKEMRPHPAAASPQSETCAACPKNAWGSATNGGRGKACSNRRVLGLIPSTTTAEQVPTAEVAVMRLPVMSGENFGNYVKFISAMHRSPTLAVVTSITTKPDPKSQFKVHFDFSAKVDPSLIGGLLARREEVLKSLHQEYEPTPVSEEPKKSRRY